MLFRINFPGLGWIPQVACDWLELKGWPVQITHLEVLAAAA